MKNSRKADTLLDSKKLLKNSDGLFAKLFKKADGAKQEAKKSKLRIDTYYNITHDAATGQAHHLSQNAAFKNVIPKNEGLTIELSGNAITDIGSAHYEAHRILETFWNQYRKGGDLYYETPTIGKYNSSLYDSLKAAGLSNKDSAYVVRVAYDQQKQYGLSNSSFVPRIPGRFNQKK